ncbi:hypothetical protein G3M48_009765 [Beauveria asiatica]|uniref:Major facilitator superfamily (MFS) profile domain-containing protein n=1 Tax=Beauveria asiatica TaxID=1069075 RepID=A0AAW0RI61_9HYPO
MNGGGSFAKRSSTLDGLPDRNDQKEVNGDQDGHRPSLYEVTSGALENGMATRRSNTRESLGVARTGSRAEFTHPLAQTPTHEEHIVGFDGVDDPYRPINWPLQRKITTMALYGFITMTSTWASAAYSSGTGQIAKEFNVGTQVATLGTTLYLFGFGIGPLLWAPFSEVFGRRLAVLAPMFISICFTFGSATAKDFQTLMITRFFGAFFGAAPVTNTGGVLGDLFSPAARGIAMAGYAMAVVGGPFVDTMLTSCMQGPIVSTAVVQQPSLGWRWTEYITGILQIFTLSVGAIFVHESYPPRLLTYKARRLRIETGNWALHAKFEEWDVSIRELSRKFLIRPLQLLFTPICFLVALYASFCYGILYMQLGAVPIIFQELRGWSPLVSSLPFLGILIGAIIGCLINVYNQFLYNKAYYATGSSRPLPEKRLPPMMVGSFLLSGGQFLLGWTADPKFHWIAPCIGLVILGTGFFTIFQSALNYLVDTFPNYAASVVAANTFLRSCFAGAFPLAVGPLFHNIGVGPGSSITGGFAALLIPVPFIFFLYGKQIRFRSKWSSES